MAKGKYVLLVACLGITFALCWHFLWSARTPKGQPPLTYLVPSNPEQFRDQFDRAAPNTRLVLLLSPT
jgi:hypothetical protein